MTTGSRKHAPDSPEARAKDDAEGRDDSDHYVERLGDRLSQPHDLPPASAPTPTPPPEQIRVPRPPSAGAPETSDVHAVPGASPSEEDDALDQPPPPPPLDSGDAFAEFEDEIEGETTRIDDSHLLAEASTAIIQEAPAQPFLEVERGSDMGREFVLQEGENGVGRGIDNDVILADVAVSRRHLVIIREGDTLKLRDLGSGNGSQVNGKKVSQIGLVDGDRIELGETVLVVRLPGSPIGAVNPYDHDAVTDESMIGGSQPPPAMSPTPSDPFAVPHGPGYQPELTPSATSTPHVPARPLGRAGAIVLPKPVFLAIIAAAALLLTICGAAIAVVIVRGGGDVADEAVTLSSENAPFDRGVRAFERRAWDDAEQAFRQALEESGSDPRVNEYLQRIQQAREHQRTLEQARSALERGDSNEAHSLAQGIPADSPLSRDARDLAIQASAQQIDQHVAAARRALRSGNEAEARRHLEMARTLDATNPNVTQLEAEIDGGSGTRSGSAEAPVEATADDEADDEADDPGPGRRDRAARGGAPRRAGSALPRRVSRRGTSAGSEAISAYLAGDFRRAETAARAAAQSASASERRELETLANRIHQFADLWQRAERGRFGLGVRTQMEQAMGLDRQIARNSRYRDRLRPHVVNAWLTQARQSRSNPTTSCNAVRNALSVDSANAEARQLSADCERTARGMMIEAGRVPPQRAISIYRQVLMIAPRNSAVAREANSRLSALARQQSYDEDE